MSIFLSRFAERKTNTKVYLTPAAQFSGFQVINAGTSSAIGVEGESEVIAGHKIKFNPVAVLPATGQPLPFEFDVLSYQDDAGDFVPNGLVRNNAPMMFRLLMASVDKMNFKFGITVRYRDRNHVDYRTRWIMDYSPLRAVIETLD